MTGTAKTEEEEFQKTYSMDVICIPTNVPVIRKDRPDFIFMNNKVKFKYMMELIREEFPDLKFGYFNPPMERIKGDFNQNFAHH